ncbi:MAG: hypothetical protein M3T55_04430 [Pseudomonadota bacterium]|nr:hypothetical protein [Pseudomonadota bacterium]
MTAETIYMPLLNEGTDVCAPVQAINLGDGGFRVLGPVPDDQQWAFAPGNIVCVRFKKFRDGWEGFVAGVISN